MAILDARDPDDLDEVAATAAGVLRAGGCVALPTDTVYGLAVALAPAGAVDRLADLKGRPRSVPIAVLVADTRQAEEIGVLSATARDLAARHWPGPLTLVVEARPGVAELVGAPDGSVGVRCPAHLLVRTVAAAVGPLATTSANVHGGPTPETAAGVAELFPGLEVVVDGGVCDGLPSTVADARSVPVRTLRQGALRLT